MLKTHVQLKNCSTRKGPDTVLWFNPLRKQDDGSRVGSVSENPRAAQADLLPCGEFINRGMKGRMTLKKTEGWDGAAALMRLIRNVSRQAEGFYRNWGWWTREETERKRGRRRRWETWHKFYCATIVNQRASEKQRAQQKSMSESLRFFPLKKLRTFFKRDCSGNTGVAITH